MQPFDWDDLTRELGEDTKKIASMGEKALKLQDDVRKLQQAASTITRVADTDRDAAFQRFHDALAEHFSPEEILEIVAVVVNMNVWTRIKLAEGAMPGPA